MRLAVIGAGISGLVAAYLLSPKHEVTVFEANARPGGHSHTVGVTVDDRVYPVDTGFVVFNETTYPNFTKLLRHLGVTWQPANMSFSIANAQSGIEFGFRTLNGLFAQRRNLVRPAFYHLLFDIWRFQRESGELSNDETFGGPVFPLFFGERIAVPVQSYEYTAGRPAPVPA